MSLQYYDINLGVNQTQKIGAQGRYIYYYAGSTPLIAGGATPAAAGNQAIKVQAGQSGNTILLMPGQSYRLDDADKAPTEWIVANFKQAETITGQVLVGEGDFRDSNTSNTNYVKLDATFANNVKVTNDTSARVPVALDPNTVINVAGSTVQYTNAYNNNSTANLVADPIFTAAQNPNGAFVELVDVAIAASSAAGAFASCTLIAKATAPASETDGDGVFAAATGVAVNTGTAPVNVTQSTRIKIAAGKGLYLNQSSASGAPSVFRKLVLYTLL